MSNHSTTTRRASALPPELTDQIIDHLHDDIHALRACSLVSRTWVPSARYHLFQEINLTSTTSHAFINLLRRSPHLSPLVQTLHITQDESLIYSIPIFLNNTLPALDKNLIHLRTLRFSNIDFSYLRPGVLDALSRQFPSIQNLSLTSVTFERFHDFASLIVSHPSISHLDLRHIWWGSKHIPEKAQVAAIVPQQPYPSNLQNIVLSDTSSHILQWLTSQYPSLHIRSITHSTVVKCDIPALRNLLHSVGSSLQDLTISIQSMRNDALDESSLTEPGMLLHNNCIRTLTLDNVLLLSSDRRSCAWIPTILSQLCSPSLEEIRLNIVWNDSQQLRAIDMECIDELLSNPSRFGQLKKFSIHSNGGWNDDVEQTLRFVVEARMKRLSKLGILLFH